MTTASCGRSRILLGLLLLMPLLLLNLPSQAQLAPGSDPIVLNTQIDYLALPTAPLLPSEQLNNAEELPSWLQAKISRFEAKAFAKLEGGDGTVYTEKDVVSRQTGNALNRTCTTEVASNTVAPTAGPSGRYGPGSGGDQIAVLRGDVITICK